MRMFHGKAWLSLVSAALMIAQASAEETAALSPLEVLRSRDLSVVAALMQTDGRSARIEVEVIEDDGLAAGEPLVDLGSVTKFVTAVAVLRLVDEGLIGLRSPLRELLPNVPRDKAAITVHQLLTHTSGLTESTGDDGERLSRDALLERVLNTPLLHPPGGGYHYSNAGYSLLAAVVEIASGKTYESYLSDSILRPLGLPPIGYEAVYDPDRSLRSSRSWRTLFRRMPIRSASWGGHAPGWNLIGNGGAVATAEGFLRFWQAFLAGRIVDPDLVALALTPHVDEGTGSSFYGYGLVVERSESLGTVYWHDGGNEVFSAEWRHLDAYGTTLFAAGPGDGGFDAMELLLQGMARERFLR